MVVCIKVKFSVHDKVKEDSSSELSPTPKQDTGDSLGSHSTSTKARGSVASNYHTSEQNPQPSSYSRKILGLISKVYRKFLMAIIGHHLDTRTLLPK